MTVVQGTDDGVAGYGVLGSSGGLIGVEGVVGEERLKRVVAGAPVPPPSPPVRAGVVGYGLNIPAGPLEAPTPIATDGVYGTSISGGAGIHGVAGGGSGNASPIPPGVWGDSSTTNGVYGSSAEWNGVEGDSWSPAHAGVAGVNHVGGPGVYGYSTGNAGEFVGNVAVSGNITVKGDVILQNPGQDCAEDFDVAECDLAAGTVVVMGEDGKVYACDSEYATAVVGIISGAGGLRPGITLGRRTSTVPRMPVALIGNVYCKVDAGPSPINVGDLLTTSQLRGHAMRVSDPTRALGTVIGKALAGLADGRGMIPVLVALQ